MKRWHRSDHWPVPGLLMTRLLTSTLYFATGVPSPLMTKLPHPRLHQLLTQLHAEPLPQEELARRLNVSTRTVRTDVATLNELIATHGAHLIHQRGSGYQL